MACANSLLYWPPITCINFRCAFAPNTNTVPDRGGRISSCGLAARRLSWNVMVRVWNGKLLSERQSSSNKNACFVRRRNLVQYPLSFGSGRSRSSRAVTVIATGRSHKDNVSQVQYVLVSKHPLWGLARFLVYRIKTIDNGRNN